MSRGFVFAEMMNSTPEVNYVSNCCTRRVETLKDVLSKMDREGSPTGSLRAMDGAWSATLLCSTKTVEVAQMTEQSLHGDLTTQIGEVDRVIRGRGLCNRKVLLDR